MDRELELRCSVLLAFALPAVMMGLMHGPEGQLQGIYAKYGGLSLSALAGAMLFTRMFDAITYPLIGHWSDASFRRTGSRKLWILAGTAVSLTGLWFLYRPARGGSIVYFTLWTLVTYIGWKLTEIPYGAWSLGLSRDYVQRTRVQLWRAMGLLSGTLLFFTVPFAAKALGLVATTELNFETVGLTALLIVVCVPFINIYSLLRVPDGEASPPQSQSTQQASWRELSRALVGNGPLLHLLGAVVPVTMLNGISAGVIYLYIDVYMSLGKELPLILLAGVPLTLLGLPFWGWLCQKFERHRVWAVSLVIAGVAYGGTGFAPVGQHGLTVLLALYPIALFCAVCLGVAVPAMMGDIVDYGRWQTGEDRSGMYSAILAFLDKSLGSVSAALGLAIVGWFGFDPTAGRQSLVGALGIRLAAVWLPAIGFVASAALVWRFPINRARQAEIREAIRRRDAGVTGQGSTSDESAIHRTA